MLFVLTFVKMILRVSPESKASGSKKHPQIFFIASLGDKRELLAYGCKLSNNLLPVAEVYHQITRFPLINFLFFTLLLRVNVDLVSLRWVFLVGNLSNFFIA